MALPCRRETATRTATILHSLPPGRRMRVLAFNTASLHHGEELPMFIIKKWFGGVVDPAQCWVNTWGDANFHEWGSLPAGGFQTGCECRISYTPDADCSVILLAAPKQRFGNVQSYQVFNRAYGKARIVQVAPTYKNDFANYNEGLIELDASY